MTTPILRSLTELRTLTRAWRLAGQSIGVVPTMGALHDGHLSLAERAKAECDRVIVTIFVNPKQFNNPDDLAKYPRTEESDAVKLAPLAVDAIWAPSGDQMYPAGFATTVSVAGLTDVLCGAHRPGHFDGVATVVTKLFLQTQADRAYFGEKDFQQLQVVRRMALDLDIPTHVVGCATVREADGLAMSSRNLRLQPQARVAAATLYRVLSDAAGQLEQGADWTALREAAADRLLATGFDEIEYLDLRATDDLRALTAPEAGARLFAACWIGGVRLIDNLPVPGQALRKRTDPVRLSA
ncbi:MAG: pantoate--beta-alanine ligase [Roseivivax sp.]|nr:pantoate--beta-alanine ligase [Roseivivax sp.]